MTRGSSYMVVCGLPEPRSGCLEAIANMALDIMNSADGWKYPDSRPYQFRIGIHNGPVTAGVIGTKNYRYDIWGETVQIASQLCTQGLPSQIQVSRQIQDYLCYAYRFEPGTEIAGKGKEMVKTYLLRERKK